MADNDDDQPKRPPPDRTVFMPAPGGSPARPPEDTSAEDAWFSGADEPEGGPAPSIPPPAEQPQPVGWGGPPSGEASGAWSAEPAPPPPSPPPAEPRTVFQPGPLGPPPAPPPPSPPPPAPAASAGKGKIAVGTVLNHIYEVRRFIARGGMGEVYEGVSVSTRQRVAIKVILAHLADDSSAVTLALREAQVLETLHHPALVRYYLATRDPTLDLFYIVTEYIDGPSLGDMVGELRPSQAELVQLTRRLASGLQVAHESGAIHRDISPDNVLLPARRLDQAKIIDFGIAKTMDPSKGTIVGDGFAGKMGFAAPEQFGDFDRQVGPWTDIYSLGLVLLSLANGRPVDMGAFLAEAIDKRRKGPDLSPLPEGLRPLFARMLTADPAQRFRSMGEVLSALDGLGTGAPLPPPPGGGAKPSTTPAPAKPGSRRTLMLAGGGIAAVAAIAVVGGLLLSSPDQAEAPAAGGADSEAASPGAPAPASAEAVRRAVEAGLPGLACSWIDIIDVTTGLQGVGLQVAGAAGDPGQVNAGLSSLAKSAGASVSRIDTTAVFPVSPSACPALDAFRSVRQPTSEVGRRLSRAQPSFEIKSAHAEECREEGAPPRPAARPLLELQIPRNQDFALVGLDNAGRGQVLFPNRQDLDAYAATEGQDVVTGLPDGFRITPCHDETALVGTLLITGSPPFSVDLPSAENDPEPRRLDSAWASGFKAQAARQGWRTEMVWLRVVDDVAGD